MWIRPQLALYLSPLLVGAFSCGPKVVVDGFELREKDWTRHEATLRARASFDFHCPKEELELTVLSVFPDPDDIPQQVGVRGCENEGVYVLTVSGWVANTSTVEAEAAPEP